MAERGRRGQRQGEDAGGEGQPAAGGLGVERDGVRAGAEDGRRGRDVGVPDGGGAGRDPVVERLRQRDELEDGERPEAEERPGERAWQPRGGPPRASQRNAPRAVARETRAMACVVRRCTLPKGQGERTTSPTRTARATLEPAGAGWARLRASTRTVQSACAPRARIARGRGVQSRDGAEAALSVTGCRFRYIVARMSSRDKPLVWLHGEVEDAPFSSGAPRGRSPPAAAPEGARPLVAALQADARHRLSGATSYGCRTGGSRWRLLYRLDADSRGDAEVHCQASWRG